MPALTRWFVKTALVYLVAALVLGAVDAVSDAGPLPALRPVYLHLFVVGWITQMIFGVAYWMFPRYSRERPRGSESLGWASYLTMNLGLVLRTAVEPGQVLRPSAFLGWLLVTSAALQWSAGLAFVVNTWGRVKEK